MSNVYVYVAYVCQELLKNYNKICVFAHTWPIKAQSDQCNVNYYFPNKQPKK